MIEEEVNLADEAERKDDIRMYTQTESEAILREASVRAEYLEKRAEYVAWREKVHARTMQEIPVLNCPYDGKSCSSTYYSWEDDMYFLPKNCYCYDPRLNPEYLGKCDRYPVPLEDIARNIGISFDTQGNFLL